MTKHKQYFIAVTTLFVIILIAGFAYIRISYEKDFSAKLWIIPPAYTGQQSRFAGNFEEDTKITMEEGSEILCLVKANKKPVMLINSKKYFFNIIGKNSYRLQTKTEEKPSVISILINDNPVKEWPISFIEDASPVVSFTEKPFIDEKQHLNIKAKVSDDYGIETAYAIIVPKKSEKIRPIELKLPFNKINSHKNTKENTVDAFFDLTSHPWSGAKVIISLQASDNSQQIGRSKKETLKLPKRLFENKFAYRINALRKRLMNNPAIVRKASRELFSIAEDYSFKHSDIKTFLALNMAGTRLKYDYSQKSVDSALDIMWKTSMEITGNNPVPMEIGEIIQNYRINFKDSRKKLVEELVPFIEIYLSSCSEKDRAYRIKRLVKKLKFASYLATEQTFNAILENIKKEIINNENTGKHLISYDSYAADKIFLKIKNILRHNDISDTQKDYLEKLLSSY